MHSTKEKYLFYIDIPLFFSILMLMAASCVILYSAGGVGTMNSQIFRFGIAILIMLMILLLPKEVIIFFIPSAYIVTILLLLATYFIGSEINGSKRWLSIGVTKIQPSELAKLVVPLMIAYYLQNKQLPIKFRDLTVCLIIILVPTALVFIQPDLGTSILVAFSGVVLVFLAGVRWKLILLSVIGLAIAIPSMWFYGGMEDYQKGRVLTFLNPERDPLGAGYNIIQSKIAIGSGGMHGKGFMQGTQSQLDFLPEHTTDFIFAVISEEFGFVGVSVLFLLFAFVILRGFLLAVKMNDMFSKLISLAIMSIFFIYFFINVGMVSGIMPVVGVPLPFISYGGTSIMTLMIGFGIIMNLYGNSKLEKKHESTYKL